MFALYPESSEITMAMRGTLHPMFQKLAEGISEFTFAGIYLFRGAHAYRITQLADGLLAILGRDGRQNFFMLPFGLPGRSALDELFSSHGFLKAATESQAAHLSAMGYGVAEDRDNFDYLYSRAAMATLSGRKLHKKKNMVNLFIRNNACQARPLLEEYMDDALRILETWQEQHEDGSDYAAAREALEKMWDLQLCGGIFYVKDTPVAYCLGEEAALGRSFVIHFEKAVTGEQMKGIYQYVSQAFAAVLPEKYDFINREQDLGHEGMRQAKQSFYPAAFVKKFIVRI